MRFFTTQRGPAIGAACTRRRTTWRERLRLGLTPRNRHRRCPPALAADQLARQDKCEAKQCRARGGKRQTSVHAWGMTAWLRGARGTRSSRSPARRSHRSGCSRRDSAQDKISSRSRFAFASRSSARNLISASLWPEVCDCASLRLSRSELSRAAGDLSLAFEPLHDLSGLLPDLHADIGELGSELLHARMRGKQGRRQLSQLALHQRALLDEARDQLGLQHLRCGVDVGLSSSISRISRARASVSERCALARMSWLFSSESC